MPVLRLSWLGPPAIEVDGRPLHLEMRKTLALLAYLSLISRSPSRETLAAMFWPEFDQQHSLTNLRRNLFSLTRSLPPGLLEGDRESVCLRRKDWFHLDVDEFRGLLSNVKSHSHSPDQACPDCLSSLEKAAAIYKGDFLEGFNLKDCPGFDEWQLYQRESLRSEYARALEKLASIYQDQDEWEKAIESARSWVTLDRLNEAAQRMLIGLYYQSGQRSLALRQYDILVDLLKNEIGQAPEAKTRTLYERLQSFEASARAENGSVLPRSTPRGAEPLIKTKLHLPFTRPGMVSRPRLQEQIAQGLRGPLTLITAPAGFGKTTVAVAGVADCGMSVAWLALDKNDNQTGRFLRYLIAAVQEANPAVGSEAAQLVAAQPAPPEAVLTNLINDLDSANAEIVLVLDDYQFISSQAVHEAVAFLIEHCPSTLHLVIATRSDPPLPLARLQGRGQMVELRAKDLRFTEPEAAQFLNEVMGLYLDTRSVAVLEERTEGWIAGLQMAALSMRNREDVSGFIKSFSGTNRYILDYLLEEVLANQPPEIQRFLLCTSILDRLTAALCEAITYSESTRIREWSGNNGDKSRTNGGDGRSFLDSQSILGYLERVNLFLVPLDDERQWFRYHHLLADLLRVRLDQLYPGLSRYLHSHAAIWFEQARMTVEAVNHYLAAGAYDRAACLVEENTTSLLAQGELNALMVWIEALPAEVRMTRPWLCIHQAYALAFAGQLDKVPSLLVQAEAAQEATPNAGEADERRLLLASDDDSVSLAKRNPLAGAITTIRAMSAVMTGRDAEAVSYARNARELLPARNLWDRSAAAWALGYALHSLGYLSESRSAFEEMVQLGRAMVNIWTLMTAATDLAQVMREQGEIRQARTLLEEALVEASQKGAHNLGFIARPKANLARLLYEQNELEQAHHLLSESLALTHLWPNPNHMAFAYALQALVLLAEGDLPGARMSIGEADRINMSVILTRLNRPMVETSLVRVWLAFHSSGAPLEVSDPLNDKVEALIAAWHNELTDSAKNAVTLIDHVSEITALTLARVYLAKGLTEKALSLLEHLTRNAKDAGHTHVAIHSLILAAIALQSILLQKEKSTLQTRSSVRQVPGLAELEEALALAQPGGYVRIFLDEGRSIQSLLAQWLAHSSASHLQDYAILLLSHFDAESHVDMVAQEKVSTIGGPGKPQGRLAKDILVEPLSQRELEVLHLMALGRTNQEIALQLIVAPGTIKAHAASIYRKLDVANRTEAVTRARQLGLLP